MICIRTLRPTPCPATPLTDVSDTHSDPSHPDPPCRTDPEYAPSPLLDPATVTVADPVDARFPRTPADTAPTESADIASDSDPDIPPAVSRTRRLAAPPAPPRRDTTAVSDTQSVPSALDPKASPDDTEPSPNPAPATVTLNDPVPATFDLAAELTVLISADRPSDTLPTLSPAVTDTPMLCTSIRPPTRQTTPVSDAQAVPSHPLCPTTPLPV